MLTRPKPSSRCSEGNIGAALFMKEYFTPKNRPEGSVVPQGISLTPGPTRDRVFLRVEDTIGMITLPKPNWDFKAQPYAMYYVVRTREEYVKESTLQPMIDQHHFFGS